MTLKDMMPADFAFAPYEGVRLRMNAKRDHKSWIQFSGAWMAVAHRFLSCAEHSEAFAESVKRVPSPQLPQQPGRYVQDRELFGFFVTGLASIESFCYGLYAVGSMLYPQHFPIKTREDRRRIKPERTVEQFAKAYPDEFITTALGEMVRGQDFRDWKEVRNILCHRVVPSRDVGIFIGGRRNGEAEGIFAKDAMEGIELQIDQNTAASKREWLAEAISDLLNATDAFTLCHFS